MAPQPFFLKNVFDIELPTKIDTPLCKKLNNVAVVNLEDETLTEYRVLKYDVAEMFLFISDYETFFSFYTPLSRACHPITE